jgi:peptide/nickel transport system substrate-binding protein
MAGCLALSGCSLLSGSDPEKTPARRASTLSSTDWTVAARDKVAQGGTLRLAATAIPRNFNPQHADAANSDAAEILAPTAGNAVRITADGGWRVDPDYAQSVKVTDTKPLTVKVVLNERAVWQGGTAITAKDMLAFWKAQNGSDAGFKVSSTTGYQDIAAVKPGTSRFSYTVTFKKPTAEWPRYVYPLLPADVSSSHKLFNSAFLQRAIPSNGPYLVASIDLKTGTVTEKPNPRWWGERPKLSAITWRTASADLQAKAYVAGELDAVDLEAGSYDTAKGTGTIQHSSGREWTQLTLNGARGPLKDVAVRRAVAHAIDRQAIATQAAGALGAPASVLGSLILVPGQRGYQDSSSSISYDPAEATRLLKKAGWVKGADGVLARKGKKLSLTMPVPAETPTNSGRAKLIARDLQKVGIQVRLRTVPAAKFFDGYVVPLDFDLVTFAWQGSPFPIAAAEPLFYPLDSMQNFTGLEDDKIGAGWDTTLRTLDDDLRAKRVAKLDEWLLADVPMVPLAVTPIAVGVRKGLVNYGAALFEQPDWTLVGFTKKK